MDIERSCTHARPSKIRLLMEVSFSQVHLHEVHAPMPRELAGVPILYLYDFATVLGVQDVRFMIGVLGDSCSGENGKLYFHILPCDIPLAAVGLRKSDSCRGLT